MDFELLYNFLETLQKNNSKEWMDTHRKEYHHVRDLYIKWLDHLNDKFLKIDKDYFDTPGKKAINRINNNLLFHPTKPIYKDHFGAGLDQKTKQGDFYIEIGLHQNLIAGGYWRPKKEILNSIREAIDYNGENLKAILEKESFKKLFGGLYTDHQLITAPKGYSMKHPHINLLRQKTFAVELTLTRKQVVSSGFEDTIITAYQEMLPFRRYLREAVSV
ncbi:DUF2461 domain-containing protein [Dokdonia sp. Hel_I_53]|uniref:DUF2461 domain-containing protein n=1 Tax=Dokdonia sp. Hel_I_53 TaxID=1566287 RepID=UPI00119B89DD|nr:DUF2461 domain-containing protein [Dokdonia sp. Hel_I_53]TVZ52965.1 uncharacterized protein (TIGR02453 family) [Dokdonia sp. Hel_I_53]